jgi:hypothetical protein
VTDPLERHSRMPRKYLATGEPQERSEDNGQFMPIPADKKTEILAALKTELLAGGTLESISSKYEVSPRTLSYWCSQLGDEYREIRKQWLDAKLVDAEVMMQEATDPFKLAKGRELFRAASWYAERRDPERYADKRELTVKNEEPQTPEAIREKITQLEQRLGVKTIEATPA